MKEMTYPPSGRCCTTRAGPEDPAPRRAPECRPARRCTTDRSPNAAQWQSPQPPQLSAHQRCYPAQERQRGPAPAVGGAHPARRSPPRLILWCRGQRWRHNNVLTLNETGTAQHARGRPGSPHGPTDSALTSEYDAARRAVPHMGRAGVGPAWPCLAATTPIGRPTGSRTGNLSGGRPAHCSGSAGPGSSWAAAVGQGCAVPPVRCGAVQSGLAGPSPSGRDGYRGGCGGVFGVGSDAGQVGELDGEPALDVVVPHYLGGGPE